MDRNRTILIAEDSEEDVFFLQAVFGKLDLPKTLLRVVSDGDEAVSYLQGEGEYADRARYPWPDLFLTDIKMPGRSGFDVLRWMQEHPEWRVIPTMVLSNSSLPQDVARAYELGAQAYLVKPSTVEEWQEMLRYAYEFWQRCARPEARGNGARGGG